MTISSINPSISILIVDDDKVSMNIILAMIVKKFLGLTVHCAHNGKHGLELFREHTHDIVITDIKMPMLDGVQMAVEIRKIKTDAKLIVLTGETRKAILEETVGKFVQIDHYIIKPVEFGALFAAIEQCLGEILQNTCTSLI